VAETTGAEVGLQDAFQETGVDSLMATEVRRNISSALGGSVPLSNTLLFDYPTVDALSRVFVDKVAVMVSRPTSKVANLSPFIQDLLELTQQERLAAVQKVIVEVVAETTGAQVGLDDAFQETGVDSLMATEVRRNLQSAVGSSIPLSNTLLFDYPTVDALSHMVVDKVAGILAVSQQQAPEIGNDVATDGPSASLQDPIAMTGAACRAPGGCTGRKELWDLLCLGRDSIQKVPESRFDVDALDGTIDELYVKQGHFLDQVEMFDNMFFRIGAAEAKEMDPNQRLLLETTYEAAAEAGYDKGSLMGSDRRETAL